MSTSISEPAVEDPSSSSSSWTFREVGAVTEVRDGSDRAWKGCFELCLMAWGGERLRTKAGIPLGPVGAIFGEVILCCDDDNDGLRLRSFLCIAERVRSDLGIRANEFIEILCAMRR